MLIYRLYIKSGVEILHHIDSLIKVKQTLDVSLVKSDDNVVALQCAPHPPAQMLEMFATVPPLEPSCSTIAMTPTVERPLQSEVDLERGSTTTASTQEVVPTPTTLVVMVYLSMTLFRQWRSGWPILSHS